jgi:hypothetical protein
VDTVYPPRWWSHRRPDPTYRWRSPDPGARRPAGNGRLFCEHKLGALETAAQRGAYSDLGSADKALVIKSLAGPPVVGFDHVLTWTSVARRVDRLAREKDQREHGTGRRWRARTHSPDASAIQCRRLELIEYLRRKDRDVQHSEPLTTLDIATFARARSILFRMRDLFELVVVDDSILQVVDVKETWHARRSYAPDEASFEAKEAKDSWAQTLRESWPSSTRPHIGRKWS